MTEILIPDYVLAEIGSSVGSGPPERGGALMGIARERAVITHFLFDPDGEASHVEYQNSRNLLERIADMERESAVRFLGILHSHPAGCAQPSGQDRREFEVTLRNNNDMVTYLSPIVTFDNQAETEAHQLKSGAMRCSFFASTLAGRGLVSRSARPRVLPIRESMQRLGVFTPRPLLVMQDHEPTFAFEVRNHLGKVLLLMPPSFPQEAPLAFNASNEPVPLPWNLDLPESHRLAAALRKQKAPRRRSIFGRRDVSAPTDRSADLLARSNGLLAEEIQDKSVLIAGLGSVGSDLAEMLARCGVGHFTLIDPDRVEAHNLGRSRFTTAQIGLTKVEAVERSLQAINPAIEVETHASTTADLGLQTLADTVSTADLVIAATDANDAQSALNHMAYAAGVLALFIGLYERAEGGEVIMSLPGHPCWQCSTAGVRASDTNRRVGRTDYLTGRLAAEPGLLADIQLVTSGAARIALGLLEPDGPPGEMLREVVEQDRVYVAWAMRPRYWIFPDAMAQAFGQHMFQTVWMKAERRVDCPVCGDDPSDPVRDASPAAELPLADLRGALRTTQSESPGDQIGYTGSIPLR